MRNKKQLLEKELELKIELAKINFMECGLSEQESIQYIKQTIKNCIQKDKIL